jgi:hypothetical protein
MVKAKGEIRITIAEMKLMRRRAKHTWMDHRRNEETAYYWN